VAHRTMNQCTGPAPRSRKSAPDSKRGILATWERERFKTFCPNHPDALQTVADVSNDIKQLPTSAIYDAALSCGCRKTITVNLTRPTPVAYSVPVFGDEEREVAA
jgi:predicted peptidase